MGSRLSIAAGLVAGVVVAFVLLVAFIFVGPDPGRPRASAESSAPPEVAASASPVATAIASGGSASPGASAGSGEIANFHIGESAPALVVPQVGGGEPDGGGNVGNGIVGVGTTATTVGDGWGELSSAAPV